MDGPACSTGVGTEGELR